MAKPKPKKTRGQKRRAAIRKQFKKPSQFNDNIVWVNPNIIKHGIVYVGALIKEFTKLIGDEMEVKLVAHTYETKLKSKKLDYVEFRFASGLSLFTETFQGLSKEGRDLQHKEIRNAIKDLKEAGAKIIYDLNGLKAF